MKILFLRPDFDIATRLGAYWLKKLEGSLSVLNSIYDLYKPEPDQANQIVKMIRPDIIVGEGHGADDVYTLQDKKAWLIAGYMNPDIVGSKIYLLSCRTGSMLGKFLVRNGVREFIGYTRDYIFVTNSTNPEDKYVVPFFDTFVHMIYTTVTYGVDAGYKDGINRYNYWIKTFAKSNDPLALLMTSMLYHDMSSLVAYPVLKEEKISGPPIELILFAIGVVILILGILSERHAK